MKRLYLCIALGLTIGLACGGDDSDDGDSANDSMNDSMDQTSSSMETCASNHSCINDVCECTTPGKEGDPCTDDDACVDECEVCV